MKCVLLPGDALYVPGYTYHHVVSVGEPSEDAEDNLLNIAVNVWFGGDERFSRMFEAVHALLLGGHPRVGFENNILRSDVPLHISFTTETVLRDDPAEDIFLTMLVEPEALELNEPLIVPVFGRGRTFGGLAASQSSVERIVKGMNSCLRNMFMAGL